MREDEYTSEELHRQSMHRTMQQAFNSVSKKAYLTYKRNPARYRDANYME